MAVAYANFLLTRRIEKQRRKLHRRVIRDKTNPFELPDAEFFKLYRSNKDMALYLCRELYEDLAPLNCLGLPVHIKVLTALHYLGTGHYQRGVGQDHVVSIAQTTVSKYLGQFSAAVIQRLKDQWIKFPSDSRDRERVALEFTEKFGVPNVLGAIDCTQVEIFPPPEAHGAAFRNRHGMTSINTQIVCDASCRILHINARFPGSVHDAFIYNSSNIKTELRRLYDQRIGRYFLIGDSGYPLEPWLMTPILHAEPNSPEDLYTKWHCKARNTIERTNGYLKGSFRCLGGDRRLYYSVVKSSELIYTCAVLYNMKLHYRIPVDLSKQPNYEELVADRDPAPEVAVRIVAQQRRQELIEAHFT